MSLPFDDSRRLLGANLFFAGSGAVLEVASDLARDETLLAAWRERVIWASAHVGWRAQTVVRRHAAGASLALTAPVDQLFLATEINEWALSDALGERDPARRPELERALAAAALESADNLANPAADLAPVLERAAAFARFGRISVREARPALRALLDAAEQRGLMHLLDEEALTLGSGAGGRSFRLDELPSPQAVPWETLHEVPTALVTGSNGKTTTVRLIAACAQAYGLHAGYNCTDGVVIDGETVAAGDYSGPAGARRVLRDPRTQAAVLETARGGILRRGITVSRADVAVVTNVSADHFGEYGIDDLEGLAAAKLTIAAVVERRGLLVLNADDKLLVSHAPALTVRLCRLPTLGWFALDADRPLLAQARARGLPTCGGRAGRLLLSAAGGERDLGELSAMPLTVGGVAAYNAANLAAAALAAQALGIPAPVIAHVFARFGADRRDNPGRLMRFEKDGAHVLVDYAHNPEGLRGFLEVAQRLRGPGGRLGLMLGHAGNRQDADIEEVAHVAAQFHPDLVVVKENEAQLRGRAAGEVPRLIHAALRRCGLPETALPVSASELEAARIALDWARPGDVLALPVHSAAARAQVVALLDAR